MSDVQDMSISWGHILWRDRLNLNKEPMLINKTRTWTYLKFDEWRRGQDIRRVVDKNSTNWKMIKTIITLLPPTDENIFEVARLLMRTCRIGINTVETLMDGIYRDVVVTNYELVYEAEEADYED